MKLASAVRITIVAASPLLLLYGCKFLSNKQAVVNMEKTCVITVTGSEQLSNVEMQREWNANMNECTIFMNALENKDSADANLE